MNYYQNVAKWTQFELKLVESGVPTAAAKNIRDEESNIFI
jgi:hypothetical protein